MLWLSIRLLRRFEIWITFGCNSVDHKQLQGQQVVLHLSSDKSIFLGFLSVGVDWCTLLDHLIFMIEELSFVYKDDSIEKEAVSRKILHEMLTVMLDIRCSIHKTFNEQLSQYKKDILGNDSAGYTDNPWGFELRAWNPSGGRKTLTELTRCCVGCWMHTLRQCLLVNQWEAWI